MSSPISIYCIECGSNCCLHLQESHARLLTPRELTILRALMNPRIISHKNLAFELGLSTGTVKIYICRLCAKLGWTGGSVRELTLWAVAHHEQLGLELPKAEQWPARPIA